ncbi:DinB family protein [Neorhodopirellula lusitana]|nr:DinB family protein [Neorhodopirellula lusitana]
MTKSMHGKEAIRSAMGLSDMVYTSYLGDMEDAELMLRPAPGCNHLAWQTGHLIASEVSLLKSICPDTATELPEGFAEAHGKENIDCDDASKFCSKDEYLALMKKVRETSLAALDAITDEQLAAASPEQFQPWCPTVGAVFVLIGSHALMHSGQVVPVRRQLGKPVVI